MTSMPLWIPETDVREDGPDNTYRWAVVTQINPLRIRLDGDTAELPLTPETVGLGGLNVGERVWVQLFGRRVIVTGRAGATALVGLRSQMIMNGGGVRYVDTTGVGWSQRFIVMGHGLSPLVTNGHWNIDMPPDGTVIPVHGNPSVSSVTVASGRIPMINWYALYYDLPLKQSSPSQANRFHIVSYTQGDIEVPATWVLVATRNGDTRAQAYKWGDGRGQDYWKALVLQNGWLNYGSSWMNAAYRMMPDGQVKLRGLIKSGTVAANTPFATFATDLAPEGALPDTGVIFYAHASGGGARVDVHSNGEACVMSLISPATNAFVSLDGISWFPSGA